MFNPIKSFKNLINKTRSRMNHEENVPAEEANTTEQNQGGDAQTTETAPEVEATPIEELPVNVPAEEPIEEAPVAPVAPVTEEDKTDLP